VRERIEVLSLSMSNCQSYSRFEFLSGCVSRVVRHNKATYSLRVSDDSRPGVFFLFSYNKNEVGHLVANYSQLQHHQILLKSVKTDRLIIKIKLVSLFRHSVLLRLVEDRLKSTVNVLYKTEFAT